MANAANVEMGRCQVIFDGEDLGHTLGGVTITIEPDNVELTVDQYGSTPVEIIQNGISAMITCRLAEPQLTNIGIGIPTGTRQSGGLGERLAVGSNAGKKLSDFAGSLRLHPTSQVDADQSKDWTFYKAVVHDSFDYEFTVDNQRVIELTFKAMIDETKAEGNRLFHFGVPAVS